MVAFYSLCFNLLDVKGLCTICAAAATSQAYLQPLILSTENVSGPLSLSRLICYRTSHLYPNRGMSRARREQSTCGFVLCRGLHEINVLLLFFSSKDCPCISATIYTSMLCVYLLLSQNVPEISLCTLLFSAKLL